MPRACSICIHKHRDRIEKDIIESVPYSSISKQYGISKACVSRHIKSGHIALKLKKAEEIKDLQKSVKLADKLERLEKIALDTIQEAADAEDLKTKCTAIREYRATIELSGKVSGEYRPGMEITGKDGGPIRIVKAEELTDDELAHIAASGSK